MNVRKCLFITKKQKKKGTVKKSHWLKKIPHQTNMALCTNYFYITTLP